MTSPQLAPQLLTPHQSQYVAWLLTRRAASDSVESLASTLVDSQVDLNPHQIDAALFACCNPLSRGVLLADEVGLGKTIEAGLVISQRWAERRRKILIVVPANLRKQWHQELQDKFGLQGVILESRSYHAARKQGQHNPFLVASGPIICSYQFAKAKADDIKGIDWHLVVLDEAHRLRNVYKTSNVIGKTLKNALAHVSSKVLLTATPLQNSLLELYGLVSIIDERVFGDLDSFRSQFNRDQGFDKLRQRLASVCLRTLRRQVQPYVSYTARKAIVQEFTPSSEEQELSRLVADYLRRPDLKALPSGQRQLISLVLWKLLASSSHAIAGALDTMARRLQGVLDKTPVANLAEHLDEDYETLDELADESSAEESADDANGQTPDAPALNPAEREAIAREMDELRHFKTLATSLRDNTKGKALLTALDRVFVELSRLGAANKAIIFTESRRTQDYLLNLLADTPYGDGIVLFNGTNSDARAQAIYQDWLQRHQGTDRITGSKTADTRAALGDCATFDEGGFTLHRYPAGVGVGAGEAAGQAGNIPLGRYELPRRSGDAHLYRVNHPLALAVIEQAKTRALDQAKLVLDYDAYGKKVSTLEPCRGKAGWLTLKLIEVEALGNKEQHLLVAASTIEGIVLAEDDPEKLLRLPASALPSPACEQAAETWLPSPACGRGAGGEGELPPALAADVETRKTDLLRGINQRNLGYFEQEVQKLDAWSDDLKLGLEQDIKEIDRQIKEVRHTAALSPTLEEKLSWQKKQRELESKRGKLRRELFARQDDVEAQRNDLISQLEGQLKQQVQERTLFTIQWELQ